MKPTPPNLFAYDNYRTFLADWVGFKKKSGRFSLRQFAAKAGFRAHHMMQLIISGRRNLSLKSIPKFTHGLGLTADEAEFFETLVLMNQTQDMKKRVQYYQRIVANPERQKALPLEKSRLAFFRNWLGPVIYAMAEFADFKPDPAWIARRLSGYADTDEIETVLSDLQALKILVKDSRGRFVNRPETLDTGDEVQDVHLYSYHENALAKAADALSEVEPVGRHFEVITMAVPEGALPKMKELTTKYVAAMVKAVSQRPGNKAEVYQVSFQLFPVARQVRKAHAR